MTDDTRNHERRVYQRARLKDAVRDAVNVELRVDGAPHPLARLVDITPGGLGVHSPAPLQKGVIVEIIATVGGTPSSVHGTVGWCKPETVPADGVYRIGIILDKYNLTRNLNFFVALGRINIELK